MNDATIATQNQLPTMGLLATLGLVAGVALPTAAKGPIVRRRGPVGLAERFALDSRAVERLQHLRDRYGPGPLMLAVPRRSMAVVLDAGHVRRILDGAPTPFAPASDIKRAALAHFEPAVSLASRGSARTLRRDLNDTVLEIGCPRHSLAGTFRHVIDEEMARLLAPHLETLTWSDFHAAWTRSVRRIVLGEAARDDHDLTALLDTLRRSANWAFLVPLRPRDLERFHSHLATYLRDDAAGSGSLAAIAARSCRASGLDPAAEETASTHQLAHYMFAYDAAGIALFRALALLAAHPEAQQQVADERPPSNRPLSERPDISPMARATLLESLRLWPTTPVVLRQSLEETAWPNGIMPKDTELVIFAPYFHRNARLPFADRFAPEIWLDGSGDNPDLALIPFSAGPARCPGRELVEMTGAMALGEVVGKARLSLEPAERLEASRPMPGTLDHFALEFRTTPR